MLNRKNTAQIAWKAISIMTVTRPFTWNRHSHLACHSPQTHASIVTAARSTGATRSARTAVPTRTAVTAVIAAVIAARTAVAAAIVTAAIVATTVVATSTATIVVAVAIITIFAIIIVPVIAVIIIAVVIITTLARRRPDARSKDADAIRLPRSAHGEIVQNRTRPGIEDGFTADLALARRDLHPAKKGPCRLNLRIPLVAELPDNLLLERLRQRPAAWQSKH
ncbi:hypothetical protein [Roseovarius faecimaris]|uniref:hypothetical protein n=1 Tax=Roseovarius faecimaris TaxID=2494550 RepID=UPI0012FD552B|nr:hypothetical protein [Roseovarius faecimaris]